MGDEAYGGDLAFLVSFAFWRLVFFLYTSLEISPKLGYILLVCALARLISASSKEKILRLIVLRSNLKSNLQILLAETHTLKTQILNLQCDSTYKNCAQRSNSSRRRGWGIVKGEGSDFVIQAPSPLTRMIGLHKNLSA